MKLEVLTPVQEYGPVDSYKSFGGTYFLGVKAE
jgi:hypothetical protein